MIKLNYRPEIDGLRAIAVLSVIIYHVEIFFKDYKILPGGYIGVDIFFVISGYLITSLILGEIKQKHSFSILNFYERRARRILPALFFIIAISIIFAWIYLTPSSFFQFSESMISSVFFFSNYFFYFEGLIYNTEEGFLKPLLHTWSLSVEEQFYIFFPILLIFVNKYLRKNFLIFFVILFFISFIVSVYTTANNSSLSFFSSLSRGWELLAGSLLAHHKVNNKKIDNNNNLFSLLGLILIFFSLFYFNNNTLHPSFATLLPISGVVLIIFFSEPNNIVNKILSNIIFVKIGLISYSLYLWHFPILAFARNRGKYLSDFDKIELLSLTIVLSIFSYFLIEKPFRKKNLIKFRYVAVTLIILVICFISLNQLSNKTNGFENRLHVFLKKTQRVLLEDSMKDENGKCFDRINNYCDFNKNANRSVFLIGDSHSEILSKNLYEKIKVKELNYISINRGTCIYLPKYYKIEKKTKKEFHNCTYESKNNIDRIIKEKKNSIIILGGNFKYHFYNQKTWEYISELDLNPLDGFIFYIKKLLNEDYKVILVYPIPSPGFHVIKRLMHEIPKNTFNASKYLKKNPLTFDLESYYDQNNKIIDEFNYLEHRNLIKIFPHQIFCNSELNKCYAHDDKNIFYSDANHLAIKGVKMLNEEIYKGINLFLSKE